MLYKTWCADLSSSALPSGIALWALPDFGAQIMHQQSTQAQTWKSPSGTAAAVPHGGARPPPQRQLTEQKQKFKRVARMQLDGQGLPCACFNAQVSSSKQMYGLQAPTPGAHFEPRKGSKAHPSVGLRWAAQTRVRNVLMATLDNILSQPCDSPI